MDGTKFIKVGTVASLANNGNSAATLNYTFTDDVSNLSGVIYYRLKQVDKDGKSTYTQIVSVDKKKLQFESFKIFPNPTAHNNINLSIQLNEAKNMQVFINNLLGELVYTGKVITLQAGFNTIKIADLNHLKSGTYLVALKDEKDKITFGTNKLIIQ